MDNARVEEIGQNCVLKGDGIRKPIDTTGRVYGVYGRTTNFEVWYDVRLGDGERLANGILTSCENDYVQLRSLFGRAGAPSSPIVVKIDVGSFGGYHRGCAGVEIHCAAFDGQNADLVRLVIASQLAEVLASGRSWNCGSSAGEGLSRVLAAELFPDQSGRFATAALWLDGDRPDWVSRSDATDTNQVANGCSVLFLNYLHSQLNYSWGQIISTAPRSSSSLTDTYAQLTGRTDAFSSFTSLLERRYPRGIASGLTTDNPFPLSDPVLSWRPVVRSTINRGGGAWHAGHVNDAVPLEDGSLLVGTDTGGLWLTPGVSGSGQWLCVSDGWDDPNIACLEIGPRGVNQVFAATASGLAVSDWTAPAPHQQWVQLPRPAGVSSIFRLLAVPALNRLVAASDIGVHYTKLPDAPGGQYNWQQVPDLATGRYSGLALGPESSVVAAYWGTNPDINFYGMVVLTFDAAGDLVVTARSDIGGTIDGVDPAAAVTPAKMRMTTLTSSPAQRQRMYAAAAGGDNPFTGGKDGDWLLGVLRSDDGGQTWRTCGTSLSTSIPKQGDLVYSAGNQGDGWNNCITASPVDPDVVVLGWRNSGSFLSTDGGRTWQLRSADQNSPHLHSDIHALRFDPHDTSGHRFYVCSDGGVAVTDDLAQTFNSRGNVELQDLQFVSAAASPAVFGQVAGGLQDNGIVWGRFTDDEGLHLIVGGDGLRCVFLQNGTLIWTSGDWPAPQISIPRPPNLVGFSPVPVTKPKPGQAANPAGLQDTLDTGKDKPLGYFHHTDLAAVRKPSRRNSAGQLMYAVAGLFADAYGLYSNSDGGDAHWEYLGSVDIDTKKYQIQCLASWSGSSLLAGTNDGRIFSMDTASGTARETNVTTRTDTAPGEITRIVAPTDRDAWAIHGVHLLVLTSAGWQPVTGLPAQQLKAVDVLGRPGTFLLFVATDKKIWVSRDAGATWRDGSAGLPASPHCSDLCLGPELGPPMLYLSTYGRSMWYSLAVDTPLPILRRCSISFHTNDEDKDGDTTVTVRLRDTTNVTAAFVSGDFDHFDDHTDAGPFPLDVMAASGQANLQAGDLTLRIDPNGHDTWRFDFTLSLELSDGSHLSATVRGLELTQDRQEQTFALGAILRP